jgi:hypothetical protein
MSDIIIRVAGAPNLILEGHGHICGDIENGIGATLDDPKFGSFVIDWDSFEAAYLALKATREEAERAYADELADPGSIAAAARAHKLAREEPKRVTSPVGPSGVHYAHPDCQQTQWFAQGKPSFGGMMVRCTCPQPPPSPAVTKRP